MTGIASLIHRRLRRHRQCHQVRTSWTLSYYAWNCCNIAINLPISSLCNINHYLDELPLCVFVFPPAKMAKLIANKICESSPVVPSHYTKLFVVQSI